MEATKETVIAHLRNFRHSSHTNVKERRLTNHDALAFIVFSLGTVSRKEIGEMMSVWRHGKGEYLTDSFPPHRQRLRISFGYLLNTSTYGGYGFVGEDFDHTTNEVYGRRSAVVTGRDGKKKWVIREWTTERRTYWYRLAKGRYAPTLECAKRMAELNSLAI